MESLSDRSLDWVLSRTGYTDFHPEKLSRQTFFELTDSKRLRPNATGSYELQQLCDVFINKIKHCHNDARNLPSGKPVRSGNFSSGRSRGLRSPLRQQGTLHPLDVITVVYLCCDPIARQDLVRLLWECKFAIPLMLHPDPGGPITIYTWPLKALKYRPINRDSCERPVTDLEFSIVSFLRFGKIKESKSKALNMLVCQSTEDYPTFFHRDSRASARERSDITNGLVETTFAPVDEVDFMFLNLRGDGLTESKQTAMLMKTSDTIVLFCEKENIEIMSQHLIDSVGNLEQTNVLILIADVEADDESECSKLEHVMETLKQHIVTSEIDIIPIQKLPKPDLLEEMTGFIRLNSSRSRSVDTMFGKLNDVDENADIFRQSTKLAEKLVKKIGSQSAETLLPCQGEVYTQWTAANKGLYRASTPSAAPQHKQTLKRSRAKQEVMCKDHSKFINGFVEAFKSLDDNDIARQLFLRSLHLALESKYQRVIAKCQEEHKRIMFVKANRTVNESDLGYSQKLFVLEEKMSQNTVTLSMLVKELGQMYEALRDRGTPLKEYEYMPQIAVEIMMAGYPLEIMDGKTTTVPITWINAVLEQLNCTLQDPDSPKDVQIRVISILGIQSSGKSTLLNTMFGPSFPVGSGRCTRGVNMHVVKASRDVAKEDGIDYLLVVDGEGISALEYEQNLTRERELATFVLGLADSTIINIMSENTIYLRDILPISVHAFLRMDLVGIEPKCTIAHQNVDPMSKDFMMQHWDDLKRTLDDYTKAACSLEGVNDVKRFQDVVKLDITKDIYCIPSYRRKYGQVDVVNQSYSEKVAEMLDSLQSTDGRRLVDFQKFLSLLWTALKRENFVYEFRNTLDIEARIVTDDIWCICAWQMRIESRKLLMDMQGAYKASTVDECENTFARNETSFKTNLVDIFQRQKDELRKRLGKAAVGIMREPVKRLKPRAYEKLEELKDDICKRSVEELSASCSVAKKEIRMLIQNNDVLHEVVKYIKEERTPVAESHSQECEKLFQRWYESVSCGSEIYNQHSEMMQVVAEKTLIEAFPSYSGYISEEMQVLSKFDLLTFCASDKHVSYTVCQTSEKVQNKELANKLVKKTKEDVLKYFERRNSAQIPFDADVFPELIKRVKYCEEIEKCHVATRKTFQVDLALCVTAYALKEFQDENSTRTVSEKKLDLSRKKFQEIYDRIIQDEKLKLVSYFNVVKDNLTQKILGELCELIVTDVSKYKLQNVEVFRSKRSMLLFVLVSIIQEKDAKQIYSYIHFQKGCFHAWMCSVFDKYFSETGASAIREFLDQAFSDTIEDMERALILCEVSNLDADSWKRLYHEKIGNEISISGFDWESADIDQAYFRAEMMACFNVIKEDIRECLNETFLRDRHYEDIRLKVVETLLGNMLGCTEMCPGCGEICLYGQRGHDGQHKCLLHRPTLLRNVEWKEECQSRIPRRNSDWDPTSLLDNEGSMQHICYVYHEQLQRQGRPLAHSVAIPEEWKTTSKEEIEKLVVLADSV